MYVPALCVCVCVYSKWCVCVLCGIQLCVCAAAFCQHVCIMYARLSVCTYFVYIYAYMCACSAVQTSVSQECLWHMSCLLLPENVYVCVCTCMYVCTTTTQRNVTLHHVMQCNVMIFNSMSKSGLGQRKHEEMFLCRKNRKTISNKDPSPDSKHENKNKQTSNDLQGSFV